MKEKIFGLIKYKSKLLRGVLLPGAPDCAFIILILQRSCYELTKKIAEV